MNEKLDIHKLFEEAKSYSNPLISFEIQWDVIEAPKIREEGGAYIETIILPIIKIKYSE